MQQRLVSTLDHIVEMAEQMSKDNNNLKADNQAFLLELLELTSRVDAWNPATKSTAGLLAIGNEENYQRVNEACSWKWLVQFTF